MIFMSTSKLPAPRATVEIYRAASTAKLQKAIEASLAKIDELHALRESCNLPSKIRAAFEKFNGKTIESMSGNDRAFAEQCCIAFNPTAIADFCINHVGNAIAGAVDVAAIREFNLALTRELEIELETVRAWIAAAYGPTEAVGSVEDCPACTAVEHRLFLSRQASAQPDASENALRSILSRIK
jgi:hypothetical protein